jgi:hypothetical protein
MTPNIKKNRSMIIVTLKIFGIPNIRALTAAYRPAFLLTRRKILNTLKAFRSLLEIGVTAMIEKITIAKSSRFQGLLR